MINYCIRKKLAKPNKNNIDKETRNYAAFIFCSNIIETHIGTHSWIEALGDIYASDVYKESIPIFG